MNMEEGVGHPHAPHVLNPRSAALQAAAFLLRYPSYKVSCLSMIDMHSFYSEGSNWPNCLWGTKFPTNIGSCMTEVVDGSYNSFTSNRGGFPKLLIRARNGEIPLQVF